jgi:hypothetical protein
MRDDSNDTMMLLMTTMPTATTTGSKTSVDAPD